MASLTQFPNEMGFGVRPRPPYWDARSWREWRFDWWMFKKRVRADGSPKWMDSMGMPMLRSWSAGRRSMARNNGDRSAVIQDSMMRMWRVA